MGFAYPSLAWIKELERICNTDSSFKDAASDFVGKMVLHIEADDKLGKDVCLFIDVGDGRIKESAEYASIQDRPDADYILSAKYTQWKQVISGQLEPLRAIMTRKMKLVKGSQLKILKYVQFTLKMMANSMAVDSSFELEKK
jgi:putative sterol carrier protein